MKIVSYKCDVCKQQKAEDEVLAIVFKSQITTNRPINKIALGEPTERDTHICSACLEGFIQYSKLQPYLNKDQSVTTNTIQGEDGTIYDLNQPTDFKQTS